MKASEEGVMEVSAGGRIRREPLDLGEGIPLCRAVPSFCKDEKPRHG
jgi:hypothetical protein